MGTIDLTDGIYRRIYAGFITGDRINAVSLEAEAWFWRLHAVADDLGNLTADTRVLRGTAAPKRSLSVAKIERLTGELLSARLLEVYCVGEEEFLHIDGFERRQPAGKNGRRIQKVPAYPGIPGESKKFQEIPNQTKATGDEDKKPHLHANNAVLENPGESKGIRGNSGRVQPTIPNPTSIPIPIPIPKKPIGVSAKRTDGVGNGKLRIELGDLGDDRALHDRYWDAVAAGCFVHADERPLEFVAAAQHALRKGKDPVRLFAAMLHAWPTMNTHISDGDEDSARERLQRMEGFRAR